MILTFLVLSLIGKGQTDTVDIVFDHFYEIREGQNNVKYYSMLYDSTFFPEENLTFIRVLSFANNAKLYKALVQGRSYKFIIQQKIQHSLGCRGDLINIRSNRAKTDEGSLFGSTFIEEEKEIAKKMTCDYMAIEYYYVLQIIN